MSDVYIVLLSDVVYVLMRVQEYGMYCGLAAMHLYIQLVQCCRIHIAHFMLVTLPVVISLSPQLARLSQLSC